MLNLKNEKYGRLLVLEEAAPLMSAQNKKIRRWVCQCDCGKIVTVRQSDLRSGHTKSCGCLNKEKIIKRNKDRKKYNQFILHDGYYEGKTFKGESFFIDLDDYEKVKDYCWHLNAQGYVETSLNPGRHFLHRFVMDCPKDKYVDHINHNILDNRKENLRIVTASQNTMNTKVRKDSETQLKGIHRRKDCDRWEVKIMKDGISHYLGLYQDLNEAIEVRNNAEKELFKEYRYNKDTIDDIELTNLCE